MNTRVREPAVAGQFYPGRHDTLLRQVQEYARPVGATLSAMGCVVPHAGYMYSGHVAGAVYARLRLPGRFIILCPNHTGMGKPLAIMSSGSWATPLGEVPVSEALAAHIKQSCELVAEDPLAHVSEHALEVQLPFLQVLAPGFEFVPIAVGTGNFDVLVRLGNALADAVAHSPDPVLVIASSDMNHYESDSITREKDRKAIEQVLRLDAQGLYETVRRENISMCGYGPTVAMLTAANVLGARKGELIKYATSGDVSGERDMVVGYAGVAIL